MDEEQVYEEQVDELDMNGLASPLTCNLASLLELSWLTLSHLVVRSSNWDFKLVISSSEVSRRSFALFLTEAT